MIKNIYRFFNIMCKQYVSYKLSKFLFNKGESREKKIKKPEEPSTQDLVKSTGEGSPETINCDVTPHTKESALNLFVDLDLTKNKYIHLYQDFKSKGCCIIPSHGMLKKAMDESLPDGIEATETRSWIALQDLLNKTATRLLNSVAQKWGIDSLKKVKFVATSGFDSSSGHTNPQQKFKEKKNESNEAQQSLLVTSVLIICLNTEDGNIYVIYIYIIYLYIIHHVYLLLKSFLFLQGVLSGQI